MQAMEQTTTLGDHGIDTDMEKKNLVGSKNVKARIKLYIYKFFNFQIMSGLHGSCYYKP
jgi:hypothetical protein